MLVEEWDDDEFIVENEYINGMDVVSNGGYRDLEKIMFGLKRRGGLRIFKDLNRLLWWLGLKLKFNVMVVVEWVVIMVVES